LTISRSRRSYWHNSWHIRPSFFNLMNAKCILCLGSANDILCSLICCSIDANIAISNFLGSVSPGHKNIQLIVVAQVLDIAPLREFCIQALSGFGSLVLLQAPRVSLSYARNIGLNYSIARTVGFPDDDCMYPTGMLHHIIRFSHPTITIDSKIAGFAYSFSEQPPSPPLRKQLVSQENLLGRCISYSIFIYRSSSDESFPRFREDMGVGTFFGSAEETEYLLRVTDNARVLFFINDLIIYHPSKTLASYRREATFWLGHGALCWFYLKRISLPLLLVCVRLLFAPLVKGVVYLLALNFPKSFLSFTSFFSRVIGFTLFPFHLILNSLLSSNA